MTDRHAGYVVVLDREIREDDAQRVIDAIAMVRGVRSVAPVVADLGTYMANERARTDLLGDLIDFVRRWRKEKDEP